MRRAGLPRPDRLLAIAASALVLAGCWAAQVQQPPDRGQIPDGPAVAPPGMPEPVGPVTEIGRGRSLGIGWRYLIYESVDGTCTTLETGNGASSACGGDVETAVPLMVNGISSSTQDPHIVDGLVSDDVAEVWLEGPGGNRLQAVLMPLARAGLEGQVFVAFVPRDVSYDSVVALDATGEVAAREPLELPCQPGTSAQGGEDC